ncbi:MAG: hypothetical protein IJU05_01660 [Schwartzia sp.]|nr:hypothetical protein [Schwartzia sp. (in: firmicutes)]
MQFDFSDQTSAVAYAKTLGLTEKSRKIAAKYLNDSTSRLDASLVVKEAASQLGVNSDKVFEYAPYLMSRLEEVRGSEVIEPSKMRDWIKQRVAMVLSEEVSRGKKWYKWFNTSGKLSDYLKDGIPLGELYWTDKQINQAFYTREIPRALRNGDWNRFRALSEAAEKGDKEGRFRGEIDRFTQSQGLTSEGNNLYLRGSRGSK